MFFCFFSASHLYDTIGCLATEHIVSESKETNNARRFCEGIFLHIYRNDAGESVILQVEPCQHGIDLERANGDPFKYSCRTIQTLISNVSKLPFLCG
jgi:hypothetical protein